MFLSLLSLNNLITRKWLTFNHYQTSIKCNFFNILFSYRIVNYYSIQTNLIIINYIYLIITSFTQIMTTT